MKSWLKSAIGIVVCAQVLAACIAEEEAPARSRAPAARDDHRWEPMDDGSCEEGEMRDCKVQIDEDNCFVGVEICEDGIWGDCGEEPAFEETALPYEE